MWHKQQTKFLEWNDCPFIVQVEEEEHEDTQICSIFKMICSIFKLICKDLKDESFKYCVMHSLWSWLSLSYVTHTQYCVLLVTACWVSENDTNISHFLSSWLHSCHDSGFVLLHSSETRKCSIIRLCNVTFDATNCHLINLDNWVHNWILGMLVTRNASIYV